MASNQVSLVNMPLNTLSSVLFGPVLTMFLIRSPQSNWQLIKKLVMRENSKMTSLSVVLSTLECLPIQRDQSSPWSGQWETSCLTRIDWRTFHIQTHLPKWALTQSKSCMTYLLMCLPATRMTSKLEFGTRDTESGLLNLSTISLLTSRRDSCNLTPENWLLWLTYNLDALTTPTKSGSWEPLKTKRLSWPSRPRESSLTSKSAQATPSWSEWTPKNCNTSQIKKCFQAAFSWLCLSQVSTCFLWTKTPRRPEWSLPKKRRSRKKEPS